jgi:long-chain acyl-CoA synthetase
MNLAELGIRRSGDSADVVAVAMGAESLTYAQLSAESERVACGLRQVGVARGDRVLMFSENSIELVVSYLAVARIGAVFVPVHASFQYEELTFALSNSTPTAVIAAGILWDRLDRVGGDYMPPIRITVGPHRSRMLNFDHLGRDAARSVELEDMEDRDPALVCYTSGSTGRPQPVTRSHGSEIWNARSYAAVWDFRPDDRTLVTLPLTWAWGLSTMVLGMFAVGGTVVLHVDFDAGDVLREIQDSRVSSFAGTMSMYTALRAALNDHDYDLSSLRRLYRGGEPINIEVISALEVRLGVRITDAYSTTEVAPVLAVDPVSDPSAPPGTVGKLVPGARIRLVDEQGHEVTPGTVGEAWLAGKGTMLGYWNDPQLTASRLTTDGWFRTDDFLVEDEDGYYFVVGRSVDVIIRNGAKIAPAEVESALSALPGVQDSAVIGAPDEEFGESIIAFVVAEPGCVVSIDDVYAHLSDRIARFKLPSQLHFVEQLPFKRNGKRDRAAIREYALGLRGLAPSDESSRGAAAEPSPRHLRIVK